MADHSFRCGDLVRCVSKYYSEQLGIIGLHGIVMGTKPQHIHVWFEAPNRSFWLNYDILRKVAEVDASPLLTRIQSLTYSLNAEEWELENHGETYRLICYVDEVSFETLQDLRSYLDIDYHSLSLSPEGMGRVIAQVEWNQ